MNSKGLGSLQVVRDADQRQYLFTGVGRTTIFAKHDLPHHALQVDHTCLLVDSPSMISKIHSVLIPF